MGQYYKPAILRKNWKMANNAVKATLSCYDYDNGAKLMEHSYISNSFVRSVEHLLANEFKGYPFVWVGDYADEVETKTGKHNIYHDAYEVIYTKDDSKRKSYERLRNGIPAMPEWIEGKKYNPYATIPYYKYLVNYSKKEFCIVPENIEGEWQVHPLPLLTCSGNGRGGGDYRVETDKRVGSWAYDKIGLTNDVSELYGFKFIDGIFALDM